MTGVGGFDLVAHFGAGEPETEPGTTIIVEMDAYQSLKSGELNPPDAFLSGQIQVEGDMQAAMYAETATIATIRATPAAPRPRRSSICMSGMLQQT